MRAIWAERGESVTGRMAYAAVDLRRRRGAARAALRGPLPGSACLDPLGPRPRSIDPVRYNKSPTRSSGKQGSRPSLAAAVEARADVTPGVGPP